MTHVGVWIDTLNGLVRPSLEKVQEINQVSADLLANGFVSAGRLQSIVSLMAACHATVPLCLFQLRPLSSHLSRNFKWRSDPIKTIIPLDVLEVVEALQFWSDPSRVAEGVPLGYQPSGQTMTTDASIYGWGAVLDGNRSSGRWTPQEAKYHINVLEIMAVLREIHHFQESLQAGVLLVQMDNTTVQSYLNRRRGTRSQSLNWLAREITLWCLGRSITIGAVHLSGTDNVEADTLSRRHSTRQAKLDSVEEWSLDQELANLLFQVWGSQ